MTRVVLVAAMARDRVIGNAGGMPWHLPADLKHFKALTLGHPVIMGRRTFESIGRPLPERSNIVISRGRPDLPKGVALAGSFEEALQQAASETAMVIGGGEIYQQALPHADCLELTLIDAVISGDTRFPEWRSAEWRLTAMSSRPPDERNTHGLVFCSFERRN